MFVETLGTIDFLSETTEHKALLGVRVSNLKPSRLGDLIVRMRRRTGLTRSDLILRSGFTREFVIDLETNKISHLSAGQVSKLCSVFSCPLSTFNKFSTKKREIKQTDGKIKVPKAPKAKSTKPQTKTKPLEEQPDKDLFERLDTIETQLKSLTSLLERSTKKHDYKAKRVKELEDVILESRALSQTDSKQSCLASELVLALGQSIRERREFNNQTHSELSASTLIPRRTLVLLEHAAENISVEQFLNLSRALNITASDLLSNSLTIVVQSKEKEHFSHMKPVRRYSVPEVAPIVWARF